MANTVTNTRLKTDIGEVVQYITLESDGTNETGTVIYDSSAVNTAIQALNTTVNRADPLNCQLYCVFYSFNSATTARAKLEFKATTNVLALDMVPGRPTDADFYDVGGLPNYAGTGKNGDIVLTTTGLAAGDSMTIVLAVRPS